MPVAFGAISLHVHGKNYTPCTSARCYIPHQVHVEMQLQLAPPNQSEISGLEHQVFLRGGGGGGGGDFLSSLISHSHLMCSK